MKSVLFLCTGNYYRSRFAEELFNYRVEHSELGWVATSRGLAIERGVFNVGALSPYAKRGLAELGIVPRGATRRPLPCTTTDLETASHIVALNEAEHRPLLRERFPKWANRIEFWAIDDIDLLSPALALETIAAQVEELITKFRTTRHPPDGRAAIAARR